MKGKSRQTSTGVSVDRALRIWLVPRVANVRHRWNQRHHVILAMKGSTLSVDRRVRAVDPCLPVIEGDVEVTNVSLRAAGDAIHRARLGEWTVVTDRNHFSSRPTTP